MHPQNRKRTFTTYPCNGLWLAFVFFIFFIFSPDIYAQTWKIKAPDSLLIAVKSSTGVKKVDALNRLAEQTIWFSTSEAIPIVKEALHTAKMLHYNKGEAEAMGNLALLVFRRGDLNKAIKLMGNTALIFRHYNYPKECINALILETNYYGFLNDNGEIINLLNQAYSISRGTGRPDLESTVETYFGLYFLNIGDKEKALEYLSRALANGKKSNNRIAVGSAIYGMALCYGADKQYQKAIDHLKIAFSKVSPANVMISKMEVYTRIGDFFVQGIKYDSAFYYYKKALRLGAAFNDAGSMSNTYTRMAHIFQQQQKTDSALRYQLIAFKLRQHQGNLILIGSSLSNIGTVYAQMHDYPQALKYYNRGLAIAKKTGYLKYIQYNYRRLYDLYLEQNNYQKAIEYNLLLSATNDSILNIETRQKFSRIQARYESEQKQKAIEFLTKENDIQALKISQTRFMIYILGALLFLLVVIGVLLNLQTKLKARHRQMESEQKLLRSQMNPHFIFNALVSIQGFIYNNESEVAAKYLTRFARLIRLVLSNSREEFVTLQREIDMLENYLALQKMRFKNKFEYSFIVDPMLDSEFINIPPMLAQPFLENAIEQGILGMNKPGFIEVSILEKDHNVLIQVEDNGNMRNLNLEEHSGSANTEKTSALQITRERIRQLNHKHALKIIFSINELRDEHNHPSGTIAMLVIPEMRMGQSPPR